MAYDLVQLHRLVRQRKPRAVLEFGVGFSTLAMAHALAANGSGKLWTLDGSEKWLNNTQAKLRDEWRDHVELACVRPRVTEVNGELAHVFTSLPNIVPDLIYIDGPYGPDVEGDVRGLSFQPFDRRRRFEVSADVLLLESTFAKQCLIVVDGRTPQVEFLKRRLQRKYIVTENPALKFTTFELLA